MLDPRYLIPRCAIVFGDLSLNNDFWVELVWNYEIRCLIETGYAFRPFGFAETDAGSRKDALDGVFEHVANQFTDGITVTSEGAPEKPFV